MKLTALQFNDAVNAAVLAMDGNIRRADAQLVAVAVAGALGHSVPLESRQHRAKLAVLAFNSDDTQTHRSNPDPREHYYARLPILATDCDYEVVGFSGVQGRRLP